MSAVCTCGHFKSSHEWDPDNERPGGLPNRCLSYGCTCKEYTKEDARVEMNVKIKPPVPPCECRCGYRCGGPGTCKLPLLECLQQTDGKHYVRDCDHRFVGEHVPTGNGWSVTCKHCGAIAMSHDMRVGP